MNYIDRSELEQWLEQLLQCHQYRDYCPNGLQLQGTKQIRHIVTGVTASLALIEKAIEQGADTLIVHHGWFWKNEDPCIVGMKQKRIATALKHGLNIFAYHLPLDGHPKLGNNTQLGYKLGFEAEHNSEGALKRIGPQN